MNGGTTKTAHDINWEANYHLLEKFVQEHHRLPKNSEIYQSTKLGL